jgi:hypothetical protein
MPHSISINTPTNARIREIVQNLEQTYTPEPDRFIYGGGRSSEYSQSGNNGSYPSMELSGGGPKKKMKYASDLKNAFDTGLSSVLNPVSKTLKPVSKLAKTLAPLAPLLLALGERDMEIKPVRPMRIGGNVKKTAKKSASRVIEAVANKAVKKLGGRGPSERNMIVKQVMAEHGLSLPKASAFVKANGLY